MNKSVIAFLICTVLLVLCGCKKQNKDTALIQNLVEQINQKADTSLPNGTILSKCEYEEGDSLFTYYIKVNDNRYENVDVDSIKSSIGKELKSTEMKKISNVLCKNHIGLRYIYDTSTKEIEIVFSPEELSQSN